MGVADPGLEDVGDLGDVCGGGEDGLSVLDPLEYLLGGVFDLCLVVLEFASGFEDGVDEDVGVYEGYSSSPLSSSRFTCFQSPRSDCRSTGMASKTSLIFVALMGLMIISSPFCMRVTFPLWSRCCLLHSDGRLTRPWASTFRSSTCIVLPHN